MLVVSNFLSPRVTCVANMCVSGHWWTCIPVRWLAETARALLDGQSSDAIELGRRRWVTLVKPFRHATTRHE